MTKPLFIPCRPEPFYRGRPGDPRLGEWVKTDGLIKTHRLNKKEVLGLVGFPDDRGVVLNHGRPGAKSGPDAIRNYFYRLCPPMDFQWEDSIELYDLGNIPVSAAAAITTTHAAAEAAARHLAGLGATVLSLGGGHDFAAPAFFGCKAGYEDFTRSPSKFSLLNVDPHLDMRPLEAGLPHSGSAFRTILESSALHRLLVFGVRSNRNARAHYAYAIGKQVGIRTLDALRSQIKDAASAFRSDLKALARSAGVLGVTIDLDSCFEAEGTSAAPVTGFSASELCQFAFIAGQEKKVKWFDLAEAAPPLESSGRIARIGAEVLFHFLLGRARISSKNRP